MWWSVPVNIIARVGEHAAAPQREQQEGLMSDSESEFEQSLVTARMLRPMNASQQAARYLLLLVIN